MKKAVLYIHGQGGNPQEAEHYIPLFPDADVLGMDYSSAAPWEAKAEFPALFDSLCKNYDAVTLVANSIGAYFAMAALHSPKIAEAFFISPVADMERLIRDMMLWAGVREETLQEKGEILTDFGQTLSWEYLCYVRQHPIVWEVPTHILYGSTDHLTPFAVISDFARRTGADLTVMEGGEHWFHTEAQMQFLDRWITRILNKIQK